MEQPPLRLHRATVLESWLDYNGHLNEAYYVLIFSHATDALIDRIGMDEAYRQRTSTSLYTLETHVCYLSEIGLGAEVEIRTRIIDLDDKRLHLFHEMEQLDGGAVIATAEMLLAHVDTSGPRMSAFEDAVGERLRLLREADRDLPYPERAGRRIAIRRR